MKTRFATRLALVLILCLAALAQVPAGAFAQPSADDQNNNPSYWKAYIQAEPVAMGIVPAPTCANSGGSNPSIWVYRASWSALLKMTSINGVTQNGSVGFNEAMLDWSNYLWLTAASSPHLTACP